MLFIFQILISTITISRIDIANAIMIEILFDVKYHSLEFTGNNTRNTKKALSNNIEPWL